MSDNERKDEQFITCLKANESYKNIKAGFEWNDIPRFAVIVGENGSGKTALLEQISLLSKDSEEYSIFQNSLDNKILYYDNIMLQNQHYNYNDSINPLKKLIEQETYRVPYDDLIYQIRIDELSNMGISRAPHNDLNNQLQRNIQTITFEEFLEEDFSNFNQKTQEIIRIYKDKFIERFKPFNYFLKRHNKTIKDLLLNMSKDEVKQWLDSLTDINFNSTPAIFNQELLLNIFGHYFIIHEKYKRELERQYPEKLVKEIKEEVEKEIGKNPLDRINEILQQYYPKYEVEVSRDVSDNIQLICRERQNRNEVPLNQLSLGEQIIISLVLWQYENTSLDSVILLLDEPDAHLNPKMAKMLIDILKNVVVEKFNCQLIMTTHSPSSVAYCEEEDLFFMEEGKIRSIEKKETIEKLSEGVMTFNYAISVIEQIQQSNKILMVEGETDKLHIENFYQLKGEKLPFKIIACNGASNMRHVAIAFEQLKIPHEKILFLCDYDKEGRGIYEQIKSKYTAIYTLDTESLSKDNDRIRLKNYPIEMLYPLDILKNNNLLEELGLKDYLIGLDNTSQIEKSKEFEQLQGKEKYKIESDSDKKSKFANEVIKTLNINKDFEEFEGLIKIIEKKFEYKFSNSNSSS